MADAFAPVDPNSDTGLALHEIVLQQDNGVSLESAETRQIHRAAREYRLHLVRTGHHTGDGEPKEWTIVAKLGRPRRLVREWRALNELRSTSLGDEAEVRIPRPLALSEETGELFMERIEGETVRHLLRESADLELVRASARALLALHSSGVRPPGRFSVKGFVYHARFQAMIESAGAARDAVERIVKAIVELEDAYPLDDLVPVHGDFHFAQLMKSKEAMYLLDFAMLAPGDPALDVGHLLAHVTDDNIGGDVAAIRATFVDTYLQGRPEIEPRLPLYEAFAHLRRAGSSAGAGREANIAAAIEAARL